MAGQHSPMEQFLVKPLVPLHAGGLDLSFTNASLWMVIGVTGACLFLLAGMARGALVPGRFQSMAELSYEFIANTVRQSAGEAGMKFFPLIFTLFMFILFANVLGLLPYSFTTTSHIIVTFALALLVFLTVIVVGLVRHGFHFFSLFVPGGVPLWLLPIIVPIEVISFLSRPISLSVRLFANMLAGHTMLKVFALFVVSLGTAGGILSAGAILPMLGIVAVTALEVLVAGLQAYVFAVLTSIYLNDAIHLHDH
ncbi:MAG: F0F1 ATP synthase subunit A [Alphaproteobacteria bacterium]|nr:F0F1 ATP synthase subunit A [Alphaproteobacteria bacterium]